eukprot:gene15172-21244_t
MSQAPGFRNSRPKVSGFRLQEPQSTGSRLPASGTPGPRLEALGTPGHRLQASGFMLQEIQASGFSSRFQELQASNLRLQELQAIGFMLEAYGFMLQETQASEYSFRFQELQASSLRLQSWSQLKVLGWIVPFHVNQGLYPEVGHHAFQQWRNSSNPPVLLMKTENPLIAVDLLNLLEGCGASSLSGGQHEGDLHPFKQEHAARASLPRGPVHALATAEEDVRIKAPAGALGWLEQGSLLLCCHASDRAEGEGMSRALQQSTGRLVQMLSPASAHLQLPANTASKAQGDGGDKHVTDLGVGWSPLIKPTCCLLVYMTEALIGCPFAVGLLRAAAEAGRQTLLINHLSYFPGQDEQPQALQDSGLFREMAIPFLPQYVDTMAAKVAETLCLMPDEVLTEEQLLAGAPAANEAVPPLDGNKETQSVAETRPLPALYPHLHVGGLTYRAFISYKRSTGSGMAGRIYQAVRQQYSVFLDSEANFKNVEELEGLVDRSLTFMLVLTPGYLDSFWWLEELKAACKSSKKIIVVTDFMFQLPPLESSAWPEKCSEVVDLPDGSSRQLNSAAYAPEFFAECIKAVQTALGPSDARIKALLQALVPATSEPSERGTALDLYLSCRGMGSAAFEQLAQELGAVLTSLPYLSIGSLSLDHNHLEAGSIKTLQGLLSRSPTSPLYIPTASWPKQDVEATALACPPSELGLDLGFMVRAHCSSLTRLNLRNAGLGDDDLVGIAEGMGTCSALQHLDLNGNYPGDAAITALARLSVPGLTSLQELHLSNGGGTAAPSRWALMLQQLHRHCGCLGSLLLARVEIGQAGFVALSAWLADPGCMLTSLNVGVTQWDDVGISALSAALRSNLRLTRLDIPGSSGGSSSAFAHALAAALSHSPALEQVLFYGTALGDAGTEEVLKAMRKRESGQPAHGPAHPLWELELSLFMMAEDGCQVALATLLRKHRLRRLVLSQSQCFCQLDDPFPGMRQLACAVVACTSLTALQFSYASFIDLDVIELCSAVRSAPGACPSLTHLDLTGNNLSMLSLEALAASLDTVEQAHGVDLRIGGTGTLRLTTLILSECSLQLLTLNQMRYILNSLGEWVAAAGDNCIAGNKLAKMLIKAYDWRSYTCATAARTRGAMDSLHASVAWQEMVLQDHLDSANRFWRFCQGAMSCPTLRVLDLSINALLQDDSALGIVTACEHAAMLGGSSCPSGVGGSKLNSLRLAGCGIRSLGLLALSRLPSLLPSLRSLDLAANNMLVPHIESDTKHTHVTHQKEGSNFILGGEFSLHLPSLVKEAGESLVAAVVASTELQEIGLSLHDLEKLGPALAKSYFAAAASGRCVLRTINEHPANCVLSTALVGVKHYSLAKAQVSDEAGDLLGESLGESVDLMDLIPPTIWEQICDKCSLGDQASTDSEEENMEEAEEEED